MAITFDGPNRLIFLDGALVQSIRGIYSRWVDWAATNLQYPPAFITLADPPTVPVYATLINGWCVAPLAGDYTLILNDGFLYMFDGSDPICPAYGIGQEPRIRYEQPVLAVGFSTASPQQADIDAILANTAAIKKLTSLIPATL